MMVAECQFEGGGGVPLAVIKVHTIMVLSNLSMSLVYYVVSGFHPPPYTYMTFSRAQAEWLILRTGIVPEILGLNQLWVSTSKA